MKIAVCSVSILFALGLASGACSVHEPDLGVVKSICPRMGLGMYDFQPVGQSPTGTPPPTGSFEVDDSGELYVSAGALIVDDDDLTDDYSNFVQARALAVDLFSEIEDEVAIYESMDPGKLDADFTEEEAAAVAAVEAVRGELASLCSRITEATFFPAHGNEVSDVTFLEFTACKDRYDASGDGVIGLFDLSATGSAQDAALAECVTVTGADNQYALNFWGPLSTRDSEIEGLPATPRDGFTYSGITVPLLIADYQKTADFSEWEGIAFWARLASAEEAVPVDTPMPKGPGLSEDDVPDGARPQDGVGQVGIILQTIDTAAVLANGMVDGMSPWGVCNDGELMRLEQFENGEAVIPPACFKSQEALDAFPGQPTANGGKYAYQDESGKPQTPELPFCIDYSPVDATVGEEAPYRDQCWDGFRSMVDVTTDWKFYFLPFDEMRQAGWGRVAKTLRMDQIRSVNILTSAFQPVNVMVDEVAFYRRKASGMGGAN